MANERSLAVVVTANLDKMRAELAKGEAIIATTTSAMKNMGTAYDGTRTIANANAAMLSIQKIGGVTGLTEAEQRNLNATLNEGIAKYAALGKSAPPAMVAMEEATRKANTELAKQPSMMDQVNTKAVALGAAVGTFIGGMAWSAVNKLGAEIGVFAERGMQLNAVQSSFQRLAAGMNQDGAKMLSGMQTASRGLVSEYDLMTAANKAMLLGIPVTAESMETLTGAATTLGKAMGLTATKSVDDLITALGRSSPMILDNLGLSVKVAEANEAYAAKLNIVGRELTDGEKKLAFYEEAMRKALIKTEELGRQTETFGEIANRVWTSFGNIVTNVVSDFNVGMGAILSNTLTLGTMFKAFDEFSVVGGLRFIATIERSKSAVAELTAEEKKYVERLLKDGVPAWRMAELGLNRTTASIQKYIDSLKPAEKEIVILTDAQKAMAKALAEVRASERTLSEAQQAAVRAMNERKVSTGAIALALGVHEVQVRKVIEAERDAAASSKELAREAKKNAEDLMKMDADRVKSFNAAQPQILAGLTAEAKKRDAVILSTFEAAKVAENKLALMSQTGLARQLLVLKQAEDAELRSARTKYEVGSVFYAKIEAAIRARYKLEVDLATGTAATIVDRMKAQGVLTVGANKEIVDALKRDYDQMVASGLFSPASLEAAKKRWLDAGDEVGQTFKAGLAQAISNIGQNIVGALQGGGNVMKAALAGLAVDLSAVFAEKFTAGMSGLSKALAGGIISAWTGLMSYFISDIMKPSYTAMEQLAQRAKMSIEELKVALKSMGESGAAVLAGLTASTGSFVQNAIAHIKALKDGTSLVDLRGQFSTQVELQKIAADWKGVYDSMLASGSYTAATLAEAWKRYQEAVDKALGKVDGTPEGARGFPTKAQLDKAAKDAEAAFVYMKNSGLYTADTLEQAWNRWQDALIESGDKGSAALRKINDEMKSIQEDANFMAEQAAPEFDAAGNRIYGVIEQQQMDRLAALEKEKAKALESIEEQATAKELAAEAADRSAQDAYARAIRGGLELDTYLRDLFKKGYIIPINFGGASGAFGGAMAEGGSGIVTKPTWFLAGEAGPERYNFTPMGSGSIGGGGGDQTIVVQMGDDVILRKVVRGMPRYLKLIGAQ